jgi:hypothetical protein
MKSKPLGIPAGAVGGPAQRSPAAAALKLAGLVEPLDIHLDFEAEAVDEILHSHGRDLALYAAVVAVLDQPEREDLQALAQQRVRDYHLEVLRAAVAYHWLPAAPENRAAG